MKNFLYLLVLILISCSGKSQETINYSLRKDKIAELKTFLRGKNYNQETAMLIDFKIPSGKFRFFVYDLKNNKVLTKGIVSHGSGSEKQNSSELIFSNIENSYQSSLGKYEIANSYVGQFGKSYRLKGLDKTNDQAMKRAIVLHYLDCVPDKESENKACLSLGCPMLSPKFFANVAKYIDSSKKRIILYAFY